MLGLRRILGHTALRSVVQGTSKTKILSDDLNVSGSRNVASFKGNKLFGNIVEAWEKREVSKALENRNPEHFEKFNVGDAIAIRSINPYNPKRMVTFSGICIAIRNGLLGKSFLVRNQVDGVGVEQHFAFYSPLLKVCTFIQLNGIVSISAILSVS
jgi:ribosomal protein L19